MVLIGDEWDRPADEPLQKLIERWCDRRDLRGVGLPTANKPSVALAAAMFAARIIRQGHRTMKKMK